MPIPATPSTSVGSASIGSIVAVAVGGAAGTAVRHGASTMDWHTALTVLAVNVIGSFVLGLIVAVRAGGLADRWAALGGIGFCGGLTTFSTHAIDVAQRLDDQRWTTAFLSLGGTTVLCVTAAAFGFRLMRNAVGEAAT
jgi:CrcB protein